MIYGDQILIYHRYDNFRLLLKIIFEKNGYSNISTLDNLSLIANDIVCDILVLDLSKFEFQLIDLLQELKVVKKPPYIITIGLNEPEFLSRFVDVDDHIFDCSNLIDEIGKILHRFRIYKGEYRTQINER